MKTSQTAKDKKFKKDVLDELFRRVGFDGYGAEFVKNHKLWRQKNTWGMKDAEDFMDWFVKRHQKVYKSKKTFAESEADCFVLSYGWRVDVDGVARGEQAIEEGRVATRAEAKKRMGR